MAITKSDLIKQLSDSYPNLLKKDLAKFFDVFIDEIINALKNDERVELRNFFLFSVKSLSERKARNPKSGEKMIASASKKIHFKMTKELFMKINNG